MGHYCKVCGRTRANEKFSGKGHRKHICKDCSRKSRFNKEKNIEDTILSCEPLVELVDESLLLEDMNISDGWFYNIDVEEEIKDEIDEELPF